jgi:hypothetical protein
MRLGMKPTLSLISILLALSGIIATASQRSAAGSARGNVSYASGIEGWRAERLQEVSGEDGWTSLVGLLLNEGQNRFGSDTSNEVVFPRNGAPRVIGSLFVDKGTVRLYAKSEAGLTVDDSPAGKLLLRSDIEGEPTKLKLGPLTFSAIKRGEKIGLRVKDKNKARSRFAGLTHFMWTRRASTAKLCGLQQSSQPSLRLHEVCDVPLAARAESDRDECRNGRKEMYWARPLSRRSSPAGAERFGGHRRSE